jgi:hypothetical protein
LPVRYFPVSIVAACIVAVLGDFAPEVELEVAFVGRGGIIGGLEHLGGRELSIFELTKCGDFLLGLEHLVT